MNLKGTVLLAVLSVSACLLAEPVYEAGSWSGAGFTPAENNFLCGLEATVTKNIKVASEGCSASSKTLTDATVGDTAHASRYAVADNTEMIWTFDTPKNLSEFRFYTLWGDHNRNDIVISGIYVTSYDGTETLVTGSSFGYSQTGGLNTIGECVNNLNDRFVRFFDSEGANLAHGVKSVKVVFGPQDNSYGGYLEIEAIGEDFLTTNGCAVTGSFGSFTYTHVDDATDRYSFTRSFFVQANELRRFTCEVYAGETLVETLPCDYLDAGESKFYKLEDGQTGIVTAEKFDASAVASAELTVPADDSVTTSFYGPYSVYTFAPSAEPVTVTVTKTGKISILLVGGGGAGGWTMGGGGGAGGFVYREFAYVPAGDYVVAVGEGGVALNDIGAGQSVPGPSGGATSFGTFLSAAGGGGGGSWASQTGASGANGGGGAFNAPGGVGLGGQGHAGGAAYGNRLGGGGGAAAAGGSGSDSETISGAGGDGLPCTITGSEIYYAGGGGGGSGVANWVSSYNATVPGAGGRGGGGQGAIYAYDTGDDGVDGLGGGGGGGGYYAERASRGGSGGDGVLILRVESSDRDAKSPTVNFISVESSGLTTVEFRWNLSWLGSGATSASVALRYGLDPEGLTQTMPLASGTGVGVLSVSSSEFSAGQTYYGKIVATNDAASPESGETEVFSFTTTLGNEATIPARIGFWEAIDSKSATSFDFDASEAEDATRQSETRFAYSTNSGLAGNTTYGYSSHIWLTNGTVVSVHSSFDDTAAVFIDGTSVVRADTYHKNVNGSYTATSTGWHPIRVYVGNIQGGGGYLDTTGPIEGTTSYNTLRYSLDGGTTWSGFVAPADGSVFRVDPAPALATGHLYSLGAKTFVELGFPSELALGALSVTYYDGFDGAVLGSESLAAVGESETLRLAELTSVPAGTKGFRAAVTVGEKVYRSDYRSMADAEEQSATAPVFTASGEPALTATTAEIAADFATLGAGASSCGLSLVWGETGTANATTVTVANCAIGLNSVTLAGLVPERAYTVYASASNDIGGTFTLASPIRFTTPAATEEVTVSEDLPAMLHVTFDPSLGDTISVTGRLASAGASKSCVLTLSVSRSEDMSDAEYWLVAAAREGEDFSIVAHEVDKTSPRYIAPGATYWCRVSAEDTDGNQDLTLVTKVVTPSSSHIKSQGAGYYYNSELGLNVAEMACTVDVEGAGETTIVLYTGSSASTLTNTASLVITEPGDVYFRNIVFPMVGENVYYTFHAINSCETESWETIFSNVDGIGLSDATVYYWKAGVAEGDWNDPANWEFESTDPRCVRPGVGSTADFSRAAGAVRVSVPGSFSLQTIRLGSENADVTLSGVDKDSSFLGPEYVVMTAGSTLTVDSCTLQAGGSCQLAVPDNATLKLVDGAVLRICRDICLNSNNATCEVRGQSWLDITDWFMTINGSGCRLVIDDSSVTMYKQGFHFGDNANAGSNEVVFEGAHPLLRGRNLNTVKNATGAKQRFTFVVPATGYTEAPLYESFASNWAATDQVFNNARQESVEIRVSGSSPAIAAHKVLETRLMDWYAGVYTNYVDLLARPGVSYAYSGSRTWNDDVANLPTYLDMALKPTGTIVILR